MSNFGISPWKQLKSSWDIHFNRVTLTNIHSIQCLSLFKNLVSLLPSVAIINITSTAPRPVHTSRLTLLDSAEPTTWQSPALGHILLVSRFLLGQTKEETQCYCRERDNKYLPPWTAIHYTSFACRLSVCGFGLSQVNISISPPNGGQERPRCLLDLVPPFLTTFVQY